MDSEKHALAKQWCKNPRQRGAGLLLSETAREQEMPNTNRATALTRIVEGQQEEMGIQPMA